MNKKLILSLLAVVIMHGAFGQKPSLELIFTAIDSSTCIQLDSIKVMNRTQGGDTTLYWPDTVLMLVYQLGIPELIPDQDRLCVFQNYPNPVTDHTTVSIYVPEHGNVCVKISDILARTIVHTERVLERGHHSFRFTPGDGDLFFFTAMWRKGSSSIKILNTGSGIHKAVSLEYMGGDFSTSHIKETEDIKGFPFRLGDKLLYIGYTNAFQSGMLDAP